MNQFHKYQKEITLFGLKIHIYLILIIAALLIVTTAHAQNEDNEDLTRTEKKAKANLKMY